VVKGQRGVVVVLLNVVVVVAAVVVVVRREKLLGCVNLGLERMGVLWLELLLLCSPLRKPSTNNLPSPTANTSSLPILLF